MMDKIKIIIGIVIIVLLCGNVFFYNEANKEKQKIKTFYDEILKHSGQEEGFEVIASEMEKCLNTEIEGRKGIPIFVNDAYQLKIICDHTLRGVKR